MDPAVVLLILRLVGALILLLFLGAIAWLIYQEIGITRAALAERHQHFGAVRVLSDDGADSDGETVYPLSTVTSIGRAASNTIVLEDNYVSNEHALLMLRGQQWWVEDLNSRNGTLLNGIRLSDTTVVSPGDVITIGSTRLKMEQLPAAGRRN
ncbi:MAG TPA: FHA domain-containing protein [Candidatus Sulfomarinibacteraceae bacterium]|nr:FHA domain-containing protein [Candidatus Sulfomarinibacteraceae bacterium]